MKYVLLLAALAACSEERAPASTPIASGPPLAEAAMYRVHAATPAACTAGQTCEARVVLLALGEHKINVEYPTKFVPDATPGITVEGPSAFVVEAKQRASVTIRFRAAAAGTARLAGKLKLSVCTEENCEIEAPAIALAIPVS